jgi:uncharacterized protein YqeY
MTIDVEVLSELYSIMKQYVPQKDRQECADNLMSVMVDMLGDTELQEFGATDGALKRALKQYAEEDEPEYEDEDEDY